MVEHMFDSTVARIPAGLDQIAPGPTLAQALAAIDIDTVSGYDRVTVLRAHQRMVSHYTAKVCQDIVAIKDAMEDFGDSPPAAAEATAAEIRAALVLTRRAADTDLGFALDLKEGLPRLWAQLEAGTIDPRRARTIVHGVTHLDRDVAVNVTDTILVEASGLTTGQIAARLSRMCIAVDPHDAERRYTIAVADRRVVLEQTVSGTGNLLGLELPADRITSIAKHINRVARSLRRKGESRTMDQLRADIYLDLLEGTDAARHGTRSKHAGVVDIQVGLETLAGLAEAPGELKGFGPVIADIARQVTAQQAGARWQYTVTAADGTIHAGTTRRRPTAEQRRTVEAAYPTCVFPGCRMPAANCDLDHRIPYAQGGPTDVRYLAPACRHDHRIRHQGGWRYTRLPDGRHEWRSRLGHTYATPFKPP